MAEVGDDDGITEVLREEHDDYMNEISDDDIDVDWEISEKLIGKQREVVYVGPPDFDASSLTSYIKREAGNGEVLEKQMVVKQVGKQRIQHTLIFRSDPNNKYATLHTRKTQTFVTFSTDDDSTAEQADDDSTAEQADDDSTAEQADDDSTAEQADDDYGRQLNKINRICSTGIAEFGVPMPPGMVLGRSARSVIPIFKLLVVKQRKIIATEHDNINRKAFIAYIMMPVVLLVIFGASIWKPRYASLGLGLWFSIIQYLGFVIYLYWLRKKEQALEKYRAEIAEVVLQHRKKLPMVEVDNVEADQPGNDLINMFCFDATIPLGSILHIWIYSAALNGLLGILLCGQFYWSSHTFLIFAVALSVICFICAGRSYYCWRKLQAV